MTKDGGRHSARARARVAARLEEIQRVRSWVEDFAAAHGVGVEDAAVINLALDELITNICSYGFDDDGEHVIALKLSLDDDMLTASIEDDGRPFDPLQAKAPDPAAPLDDRVPGGLGLFLVRSVVDDIQYKRRRGTNLLILTKKVGLDGRSDGTSA